MPYFTPALSGSDSGSRDRGLDIEERKLNKNSRSLPALRLLPDDTRFSKCAHHGNRSDPSTCQQCRAVFSTARATPGRRPRRRWSFSGLSVEFDVTVPAIKHAPPRLLHVLPSTPPPASPRKLRATWSPAQFGDALSSPIHLDLPRLLLPCVEEDDNQIDPAALNADLFTLHRKSTRVVSDDVASSVATEITSDDAGAASKVPANPRQDYSGYFIKRGSSAGVDRRDNAASTTTTPIMHASSPYHDTFYESSPEIYKQHRKTVRRQMGIAHLRMSAPASSSPAASPSPRRPISHPAHSSTTSITSSITSIPITHLQSHHRAHSQPNNIPRLGPQRPYYSSVIRKDIPRPSTSHDFRPSTSRPWSLATSAPSSSTDHGLPGMTEFSVASASTASYSPGEFGYIPPSANLHPGFSLSGETELRMALADDDAGSYKYKDMRKRGLVKRIRDKFFRK